MPCSVVALGKQTLMRPLTLCGRCRLSSWVNTTLLLSAIHSSVPTFVTMSGRNFWPARGNSLYGVVCVCCAM